jgi:hypothetical protein
MESPDQAWTKAEAPTSCNSAECREAAMLIELLIGTLLVGVGWNALTSERICFLLDPEGCFTSSAISLAQHLDDGR